MLFNVQFEDAQANSLIEPLLMIFNVLKVYHQYPFDNSIYYLFIILYTVYFTCIQPQPVVILKCVCIVFFFFLNISDIQKRCYQRRLACIEL